MSLPNSSLPNSEPWPDDPGIEHPLDVAIRTVDEAYERQVGHAAACLLHGIYGYEAGTGFDWAGVAAAHGVPGVLVPAALDMAEAYGWITREGVHWPALTTRGKAYGERVCRRTCGGAA